MTKQPLKLLLAAPRGFCAGVDRAIQCVEVALHKYGAPVYVRHEIVHNKYVVENLRAKGAIFVEELDEIPAKDKDRPVIFSAHGVPKSVPLAAESKNMFYIDATCPLVSKVHREAERHFKNGKTIILIGHKGHPEVIGTIGQLPDGAVHLVETIEDVEQLTFNQLAPLAYCTQTTLSVDDTAAIIEALNKKYPNIEPPHKEDICYATTNRQGAVKAIAGQAQAMIVIGAPNSSNANRLVEVALNHGSHKADLVQRADEIDWSAYEGFDVVGITAGASTPEILVEEVIESAAAYFEISVEEVSITNENVVFNIPKVLRDEAA